MSEDRGLTSRAGSLALELLGVPVLIACDDAELESRLFSCYALARAGVPDAPATLGAALERHDRAWRVRVDGREARVESDRTAALRALNHELLMAVLERRSELYHVHAAVVEWRGRAVVLPGLSRAGKSTLALALVLEGARFLSDELLAFDPGRAVARAFPRALKIRDECAGYFPELARSFQGTGEGRFVPFEALGACVACPEAPVGAVVVPRWSGGAPLSLEPLTRGAALLALAEASLNFGTHRARSIDRLEELVRDARASSLVWREPREAARALLGELGW